MPGRARGFLIGLALGNFDKAATEQPNSAEIHMWRARALGRLERDEEADAAHASADGASLQCRR